MLSNVEVAIYTAASLLLLPIVVYSLLTGSKAPEGTWMAKYYAAERHLGLAGNLFLLTVMASGMMRLAGHFGLIDPSLQDSLAFIVGVPFAVLWIIYVALWIKAVRKARSTA